MTSRTLTTINPVAAPPSIDIASAAAAAKMGRLVDRNPRWWWLGLVLGAAAAVSAALLSASVAHAATTTTTFTYTGGEQTYAVPAGAIKVTITAVGAPGGPAYGGPGGMGAVVTATLPLSAGMTTLYVEVGGTGADARRLLCNTGEHAFNGGGKGACGGGGGGASDVRLASNTTPLTTSDARLVVAGGGGGAGRGDCTPGPIGGSAGDQNVSGAGNGGSGSYDACTVLPTAGGNGGFDNGSPGSGGAGTVPVLYPAGDNGSLGQGGDAPARVDRGGGGGGGYYGGGGGGDGFLQGGGGGAGSSYWVSGATGTSMATDTTGTAQVQITPVFPAPYAGTPGQHNCDHETLAALRTEFNDDLSAAAQAHGFDSVHALKQDIKHYCSGS